jgi:hypothetical protein
MTRSRRARGSLPASISETRRLTTHGLDNKGPQPSPLATRRQLRLVPMFDLVVIFGAFGATAVLGLLIGNRRAALRSRRSAGDQRDSSMHRQRAQAEADVEGRDIEDMLDAIAEYRRRAGQRDIGEEIADEILRSTWDD